MTSILSSISGQFGKSLIFSALFPAAIFIVLFLVVVVPIIPHGIDFFEPLSTVETGWQIVAVTFLAIVLAGLLYLLNVPLIRLYEGYPWKDSFLGKWRIQVYQREYRAASFREGGIYRLRDLKDDDENKSKVRSILGRIVRELRSEFPDREDIILPTRLGNVIRSFEVYPRIEYGMESIVFWPRLISVFDKEYASTVNDAKTSFDFMLHTSVIFGILTLLTGVLGLAYTPQPFLSRVVLPVVLFAALALLFYLLSIGRASAWGDMVKSAFDLYRWDLLKKLGYAQVPTTKPAERALWSAMSQQILYGDKREFDEKTGTVKTTPRVSYADAALPPAIPTPASIALESARGFKIPKNSDDALTVVWSIRRAPEKEKPAESVGGDNLEHLKQVVVADTVPDGFEYSWGSAAVGGTAQVCVIGSNPYRFRIEEADGIQLPLELTYGLVRKKEVGCRESAAVSTEQPSIPA